LRSGQVHRSAGDKEKPFEMLFQPERKWRKERSHWRCRRERIVWLISSGCPLSGPPCWLGLGWTFGRYLGETPPPPYILRIQARQVGHSDYTPQFPALEFEEMFAFSTFIIAGLLARKNLAEHKRWMILAAVSISDAGFARAWQIGIRHAFPGAFGWGAAVLWGGEITVTILNFSPAWKSSMTELIRIWGYTG